MERAYNPQTGEYLFLVNGQWMPPAQQAVNPKTNERAFLVGDQWQVVPSDAASKPRPESVEGVSPSLAVEQFKSGVAGMQQNYFANTARNNAAILNVLDRIDRGEDVPPVQDVLGYTDMGPELRKKTRDAIQSALTSTTAKTIAYGAEKEGYARNPYADQVIKLADDGEYRAAWELLKKDPLGIIQQLSVESTPNMLPSLVTGAVGAVVRGGLGAFMAGMAGGSFPVEFNASVVESLQDAKVDLKDAKAVEAKLRDPEFIKAAGERAVTRGAVIASADAVSGAVLSPFRTGQLAKNVARGAANVAKETGLEMAGEAAAQAATGEDFKVGQILAEGVGALPSAAGVTGIRTAMQTKEDVRAREDALRFEQLKSTLSQTPDGTLTPEQQIAQLSQRYQAQMPKDLADEIATRLVQSRLKGAEAAQEAGVQIPPFIKPDAAEVAQLEAALIAQGVSPQAARLEAIQVVTEDAYQTYLEQEAAKQAEEKAKAEAKDVTEPIIPAGGEGVSVAAQPDVEPPTPGTEVVKPVGVVPTTEDVGVPVGGETAQPSAVTTTGVPSGTQAPQTVEAKEARAAAPVEGATVATTAAPFVGETRPTLAAPVKPLILADTLANAAFTTRDQITGAEDKFLQLDDSIRQRRQELEDTLIGAAAKPNVQKAALAKFDAAVEDLKRKEEFDPIGFARTQARASFDQRNSPDYRGPQDAIDSGRENVNDTLTEYGAASRFTYDRAFRAYDEEIARLQGAAAPAAAPAKRGRPKKVVTEAAPTAEPKKAGRPKLSEEQQEAAERKKREQKTAFERNKRAYNRAVELLADPETRTEALHILKDLRSTSLRPQAQAAVAAAGVTPAEAKRIDDTHAEWRKQREEDKAVAAEERAQKEAAKAAKPTPEQRAQAKEEKLAAKVKDSTVYLVEILPDGKVGRLFTAFVDADSIKNAVARGDKFDRAQENVEQNAIEVAIRELSPPLVKGAEVRAVTKEQYNSFQEAKAEERTSSPGFRVLLSALIAKTAKPEKTTADKQKLAAEKKVRSKQDALRAAKNETDKQIAQLELDEAKVELQLIKGAKPEDLGLPADWREDLRKQITELKTGQYIAERNKLLESTDRDRLESLLATLRLRLAEIKQDIASGAITEKQINWGFRWSADTPVRSVADAQAEVDAYAARVQALPPPKGKKKKASKETASRLTSLYGDLETTETTEETEEEQERKQEEESLPPELKFQATRANVDVPDSDYKQDTTGAQVARRLARVASNGFQRLMALRLSRLRVLQDVKFVVLEANDPLPAELVKDLGWAQARGAYDAGTNTIYVKGESQGYLQGVNNITILHELLHAALHRKIKAGSQAAFKRLVTGEVREVEVLFNDLKRLGKRAEEHLKSLPDMPEDLAALVYGTGVNKDGRFEVFANIDEFLAYGMSDPLFQEFLKTVPVDTRTNGFSGFVRAILRYLKLAPNDQSALAQLIDITDQFIKITAVPETKVSGVLKQTALKEKAEDKKAKVDKALAKAQAANTNSPTFINAIGDLIKLRDGSSELVADILASRYDQIRGTTLRQLLPTLQTETVVEWARRLGLNGIPRVWNAMKSENAMRYALINRSLPVAERLTTLQRKNPQMFEALGTVMHFATLRGVDPATEAGRKQSPALQELWERLTPEARQMYMDVRDHYRAYNDLYHDSLIKRIEDFDIDADSKKNLLASIRKVYETSNKINPYFPLMRYGDFWVRVGKGPSGKFYMFENQAEKELFIRQWVREQQEKDPSTSRQQLYSDGAIEDGNSLRDEGAQSTVSSYNDVLQNVFSIIDKAIKKPQSVTDDFGREVKTGVLVKEDRLKDDIYQLILHTLPDKSFRKHFIHRKGKEGFSKDIARNFASLTMDMANQLSRIRYNSDIENALTESAASIKGNPDQAKLSEFVGEMRVRAQQITDPNFDDSLSNKLANLTNTTAFVWLMTTIKTAIAQGAAIPVFATPVLASKYGVFATHAALARFTPIWNSFGIKERHPDGNESWVAPTVAQSDQVRMNTEERRAAQYMVDRGISDTTMAFDLGNRRELPTHVQNSAPRRIQRTVTNVMTGLFHNVERLNREITFMAAFRLARKKYPGESFEQIALRAEQDTYDALGNFASINRPRGVGANAERQVLLNAHRPLGRSLLQFKMFPAFVTTYMVRNFWRIVGTGYSGAERKEAAIQLFGTLGYSLTLAGVMGVPGVTFALGILSGLRNLGLGDDEEDELAKRDLEFWIRNVWIPNTFGDMKVGGMSVANLLDRGAIAELTGKDITSSLSFNNMWFPEQKEQPTVAAAAQDFFLHMMGPFFSLSAQQIPKAIDKLNQGKVLEGMEQMMPGFVRPTLTAYRYSEQGATTPTGAVIKGAEEFTTGELIGQAMGFSTEGLVGMRETLFKAEALKAQVKNDKKKLLDRLGLETARGGDNLNTVFKKIEEFNRKNPSSAIDSDSITRSLENRFQRMYATERGLPIEPEFYPLVRELFNVPIEKLEREATRARQ